MGDAINAGDIVTIEGFAWCPAMANNRATIDYSTKEGQNIFKTNVACLYSDKSNCFSAKPEGLQGFLNHLNFRSKEADWSALFNIPIDFNQADGDEVSILTNYGQFTHEYLEQYITDRHLLLNDRWQQDNFQCQTCIFASLSEEALNRINLCSDEFTISNQVQSLLLIKVIIRESRVETPHRTRIIRQNLSTLDVTFQKFGYDVDKLNTYVLGQLADLAAMGERTQDVLANLFKAYLTAPDEAFSAYIIHKQSLADEGEEINHGHLMILAGNKYKGLVEAGTWNAPNKDQVKLLALEAKLDQMKKLIPTKSGPTSTKRKFEGGEQTNSKKTFKRAEWQMVEPTALEIKNQYVKKVKGKEYKWCDKHKLWCAHSTAECRKPDIQTTETDKNEMPGDLDKKNQMVEAFNAIALEDEEE